jgi:ribosome-associated protein YbcJ (S4-like RNA binding protein)
MIIINKKTVDSGSTAKTFTDHKTKLDKWKNPRKCARLVLQSVISIEGVFKIRPDNCS